MLGLLDPLKNDEPVKNVWNKILRIKKKNRKTKNRVLKSIYTKVYLIFSILGFYKRS